MAKEREEAERQETCVREHERIRDAEDRLDRETLQEAVKNADQCAQRAMALLKNNELKSDDDEMRTETLATIQRAMDLKDCSDIAGLEAQLRGEPPSLRVRRRRGR